MRLQHSRWMRLTALLTGLVALVALLVACAGDSKTTQVTGVAPVNAEAAAGDVTVQNINSANPGGGAGSSDLAPQATEEPSLAARVNEQPITLEAFERERNRWMMGLQIEPATQSAFDASVLDAMIDQVLIEQAAEQLEISVLEEDIDAELALQADLAKANGTTLDDALATQLYTMDEYREVVRGLLLVQQVSEIVANVPDVALQVHSRHILVADEATARTLLSQLQAGVDFAQLANQYSLDTSTASSGGDLGWVASGVLLQQEVEDVIFALQPGQIAAEPVQSSLGFHIVQTLERVEDRPLSPAALAQQKQQAFMDWLDTQRQSAVIERFVGVAE